MIYTFKSKEDTLRFDNWVRDAKEKEWTVTLIKTEKRRTSLQNNAMHLYFQLLSEALNDAGFDMRTVIKKDVDIPFTPETVKSHLWKPIMEAYLEKTSTTDLRTDEISPVYEILNRHIGERTGIYVPFPSWDRFQ